MKPSKSIGLLAFVPALLIASSAGAYDFSACDPATDPTACECPSGASNCYDVDSNDIPDFRNGTYSTSWISVSQSDPNSNRYTVTFDLTAAPGRGIVNADNATWAQASDVIDFLENLTGITNKSQSALNFDIVQKGESVQVNAQGERTAGSSQIWLMNVLTNSSGNLDIDGIEYDPANTPLEIDGITFPGGPSFFYGSGETCADLIAFDSSDNLWEADQCTTLDNTSLSSFFYEVAEYRSRSSITDLKKNGLGSTIEVDNSGSVPFFRLTKVVTDLEEDTSESLDDGSGPQAPIASLQDTASDNALYIINSQFYSVGDVYWWARGECGSGTMYVPGSDDSDSTSYGWYDPTEAGCPESKGVE